MLTEGEECHGSEWLRRITGNHERSGEIEIHKQASLHMVAELSQSEG